MIKLKASGIPETIEKFQLAIEVAFAAGEFAGAHPRKSFAEQHPRNTEATCKCEHWQSCADCHPTAHQQDHTHDVLTAHHVYCLVVTEDV